MPTTISASPIWSSRAFNSFGKSSSTFGSRTLRQPTEWLDLETNHRRQRFVVQVYCLAQVVEESRRSCADSHPVGDRRRTQWICEEFIGRQFQGLREGFDSGFFLVPVKHEAIDHGVGVVAADAIFGHALVADQQRLHEASIELHAFG